MAVGAHLAQPGVGVAQHVAHPLALRGERRPQPPRRFRPRQGDVEVTAAQPTVGDPLHLAVVGQEGDRPADPVAERLRVAVDVVGAADAVLVVGDPGDRRVVGAERRAGEQQPEAGAVEGAAGAQAPGGLVAHVVGLVGDQQGRPAGGGVAVGVRPGGDRLVGDGDAVEVGRLGPVGVRPVRLEVDPVAGRVGGPLAADVGGRPDDDDARDEPGDSASGGRCGGRRSSSRPPASPRRGSSRRRAPARLRSPPPAKSGRGRASGQAGSGPGARPAAGQLLSSVVQRVGNDKGARGGVRPAASERHSLRRQRPRHSRRPSPRSP